VKASERTRPPDAEQGLRVRVDREIDDGDPEAAGDLFGRHHAVHVTLELDVHEDEVRAKGFDLAEGFLPGKGYPKHREAQAFQGHPEVQGDYGLILDDEDIDGPETIFLDLSFMMTIEYLVAAKAKRLKVSKREEQKDGQLVRDDIF
jgi:hypothetical protein